MSRGGGEGAGVTTREKRVKTRVRYGQGSIKLTHRSPGECFKEGKRKEGGEEDEGRVLRGSMEPGGGGGQAGQRKGQRQGRRRRLGAPGACAIASLPRYANRTKHPMFPDSLAESSSCICPVRSDHVRRNHQPSKPGKTSHRPCRSLVCADRSVFQPPVPEGWPGLGSSDCVGHAQVVLHRVFRRVECTLNASSRTQPLAIRTSGSPVVRMTNDHGLLRYTVSDDDVSLEMRTRSGDERRRR